MFHRTLAPLFMLVLAAPPAMVAQATAGAATVAGTVADASGALIPGAVVTLRNVERGSEQVAKTNTAGNYVFPDVVPGLYEVSFSKDGFEAHKVTGLHLEVGQRANINVKLQVGQVTNVVTVEAGVVQLETSSNAIGTVVDSGRVNELPLNGRNFLQLALLSAASNESTGRSDAAGQVGHPGRSAVIGGNKAAYNSYMINGIQVRGARLGELAVNLSVANIDEFKVQQSFFMPDEGPNPAIVSVNTKSGTNQFHGQLFWFLRNKELDARNFFAPGAEDLKRNQFGLAVGGPIKKDRMWFYGGYEGLREITGFVQGAFTPTQAMFGGDFRELAPRIHDPLTLNEQAGSRMPFPNNTIPSSRIQPISRQLLHYYIPGSSLSQRPNNLLVNPRNSLDDDQFNARVDTTLTSRQSLFGQFIYSDSPSVQAGTFPLSGSFYPNELQMGMVQHTYAMTASLVNTLRFGASRNVALFSNEGRNVGDILGPLGIRNTLDVRGVTSQDLQGYSGFGRANGDLGNLDNNYQVDEGLSYIRGNHQIRLGASIRYRRTWQQNANAGAHGNLSFQRTFSTQLARNNQGQLVPAANTGDSFADFLLGMPTTGSTRGLPMIPYRFTQYMPYFQDTWKLRPGLTLNFGLSWFKDTIPEPQGFAKTWPHAFDTATGLLKFAALGQISPRVIQADNNNFIPRLGFAWQINDKTVMRAGAGIYYSDSQLIELQFSMVGPPFNDSVDIINAGRLLPEFEFSRGNIFPAFRLPPIDANFARNLPAGTAPFLLNEDSPLPYISQWNLSVQRMLTGSDSIEVAYLGSSGHRLQNRYDLNQCVVGPDLGCNRATRPYPRYTSLLQADFNGNSSYNALAVKFNHRAGGGLNLRAEYTFAKALTDSWESGGATNAQITNFRGLDKDLASFDTRHRMVMSAIWDLPVGRGKRIGADMHKAADLFIGGWTLTGIASFQTGTPVLMSSPNTTGSPFVTHRPNRLCDGKLASIDLRSNRRFLDPACWQTAQQGSFGNSSRGPVLGPGLNNWDAGIQKFFTIQESLRVQFRAEMFNAFNHTQFEQPNANTGAGANFGLVGGARNPRLVQLGLRLLF